MSDSVQLSVSAPAPAAPKAKATKAAKPTKIAKAKVPSAHPPYINMIKDAIKNLKDRKGASKQAILKYISGHYKLGDNVIQINAHLRQALKRGVTSKVLTQAAGTGANGRFRVPEKAAAKPAAAAKKPAAKKTATKKAATGEKAKKTTKKATGEKKTKTVKKAGDKVKKPKSPKKISKPTAKKAKAPAAKKAAPKKAAKPAAKKAAKPAAAAAKA
ncbi:CBN-HIS-24 protein [Caenorhabditis brenneri]|uniref:CBN-HIS-24 protein n=1 Tax=Caenorhabditis brenneri TaxID=135651 RepID=G0N1V3_CAEBE|nr:CBN-HIS-24 protein [Caenorhabditis brenneri]